MIFDRLLGKKPLKKNKTDMEVTSSSSAQPDAEEVFEGVAADVRPGERRERKSKTVKANRALHLTNRKRRVKKIVHNKRSFHKPKVRDTKELVRVYDVLQRPIITEKAASLSEKRVYVFSVQQTATKHTVADAIEVRYGVRPVKVRIAKKPSKPKRIRVAGREREHGMTTNQKKAYIFLKKGDSIQLT